MLHAGRSLLAPLPCSFVFPHAVSNPFAAYRRLPRHIVQFTLAEFFMHLGNAAFFLILNIYMRKSGYSDAGIADFLSGRHLTVMLLAYPLGRLVQRRPILPILIASGIAFPILSFLLVQAVAHGWDRALYPIFGAWGAAFFGVRAVAIPYMLRNCPVDLHSEALALNFSSWSMAMIAAGGLNWLLTRLNPELFTEAVLLQAFAAVGFVSLYFLSRIKQDDYNPNAGRVAAGDWKLIATALGPTVVIAVGAGLTIQFMNLFFYNVFGMDYDVFSLLGAGTAVLASIAVLQVPRIKGRFGYRGSITVTQSIAVLALVGLATTEYYAAAPWAIGLAVGLYALRQPMMNMANPMTSELAMYFVGEKNREMTSALTGAVWSGSWFFSSIIFSQLRRIEVPYAQIFYLTAILYALGVLGFYRLIGIYERREAQRQLVRDNLYAAREAVLSGSGTSSDIGEIGNDPSSAPGSAPRNTPGRGTNTNSKYP